jgi:hypothetical protein
MPRGPLLRSFGEAEAGLVGPGGEAVGGESFWHVNLNLTLPIRCLSRPLIPDEATDLEDREGQPVTLRRMLHTAIDKSGKNFLAAQLRSEGLSPEAAERQAEEVYDEITPATDFIIDQANLYAIKPLLMFDAGGMSEGGTFSDSEWFAVGGGVQLTIVTAKFEFGYLRTVSGPTFGDRDNLFFRLVFQNLF